MPAPTDTTTPPSPADVAIQQGRDALESVLDQVNREVFTPRATAANQQALNPVGDALAKAQQQAAPLSAAQPASHSGDAQSSPRPRSPDGRFTKQGDAPPSAPPAAPAAPASTPAAIPGPPTDQDQGQAAPADTPAAATSAPPDPDIPSADILDRERNFRLNSTNWKKLHAARDTIAAQAESLRKEVETLKAQLGGTTASPEFQQQLAALTKERDQLLTQLEAVAVERSPRFEAMFKPRQEAALQQAKEAVGPARAEQIAQLLALPRSTYRDEQISAILADLPTMQQHELAGAVSELNRLTTERSTMAAQGNQLAKQWQAEAVADQQRQTAERQAAVTAAFDRAASEWKSANLSPDEIALAKDVFMGSRSMEDIARAAMWTAYGPRAAATALQLQKQLDAANAELASLRAVQPGAASDAGGNAADISDEPTGTGLEGLIQQITRAGILRR